MQEDINTAIYLKTIIYGHVCLSMEQSFTTYKNLYCILECPMNLLNGEEDINMQ